MQELDTGLEAQPGFISAHMVAERAGVSRSAVSRAFTPGASIAPETRKKVMQAAAELGYQVNDLARGLLANRSRLVGLVASDPASPFRTQQIAALSRRLVERGSVPVLIPTGSGEDQVKAAHSTLLRYRAEATIVLSGMPSSSLVELAQRNGQPLIVVGRTEHGPDHIRVDNARAAQIAVEVFVARGLRKLGLIISAVGSPNLIEREEAFVAAAAKQGIKVRTQAAGYTDYDGGQAAASLLLGTGDTVEAVFCVNDLMAFGLMDYARDVLNLSIPEDLSVIGFDGIPEARWGAYRLTTFHQDEEILSNEIIKVLDQRQADPKAPPIVSVIEAPLVYRGSVRSLKSDG
ncbi:LacI family DNA-binding transcriptional regulator [Microvirga sp. ACRRW]|uniref:LacI family DNA-binding transcriptional regulator n=1 Tax=Microvirga sp. ACRRW TaxID=2918205 RepID=UPI001EF4DE57|nr:LacI family DNA-binding transcriptional regulator [Microvirga sp. ACRRW]MCG7391625.1 LacI family DNA-binding transcriptional regulator [Microvirga sp. ACRRW]